MCCTSHFEGFPNTFIEAWSQGVPVVSTIDPDGILVREGIGAHVLSDSAMAESIRELFQSADALATMTNAARKYYADTHYIEAAMPEFRDVFDGVQEIRKN